MPGKPASQLRILFSPLDWGLGHAARLIPLIHAYKTRGYKIILGGNGNSLEMLKNEFPDLETVSIPFTEIRYGKGQNQIFNFLGGILRLFFAFRREHRVLNSIISEKQIDLVISDNRLGLFSKNVSMAHCTCFKYSGLEGPLLLPPEPAALYATADGRPLKYLA